MFTGLVSRRHKSMAGHFLTCSSPSFTAALYISVISVDSGHTLNLRVLRICHLDEVEETDE